MLGGHALPAHMSHHFFVDPVGVVDGQVFLDQEDSHHLLKVLRARPGEPFAAVSAGVVYRCRLIEAGGNTAVGQVLDSAQCTTEPPVQITLFQGLAKGDKLEQVIQHGTELGLTTVVPVECARSVVKLDARKAAERVTRWQRIAREAAGQSRRGVVPTVARVEDWQTAANRAGAFDLALVPWEARAGEPGLRQLLQGLPEGARIALYIGPEGGLTAAEVEQAVAAGAHPVGLGPRILRTETAGLAVLAAVLYAAGDLG